RPRSSAPTRSSGSPGWTSVCAAAARVLWKPSPGGSGTPSETQCAGTPGNRTGCVMKNNERIGRVLARTATTGCSATAAPASSGVSRPHIGARTGLARRHRKDHAMPLAFALHPHGGYQCGNGATDPLCAAFNEERVVTYCYPVGVGGDTPHFWCLHVHPV